MDLVMIKQDVYRIFTGDLTKKWIPAILTYCEGSKREDVKDLIRYHFRLINISLSLGGSGVCP